MKVICLQKNIKQALNITERIIGRNLTLPILNNLLLISEGNKLKISSTNLEIGINCWVNGKIVEKGGITVPARLISGFIGNLPNKKIKMKVKENQLELKCEKFKANLKGIKADDFPIIPKIKDKPLIKIKGGLLKNGLSQVVEMSALSESRPEISGIFVNFEKGSIKMAATDSFRLAEKNLETEGSVSKINKQSIIIPQRTISELIRILGEKDLIGDESDQDVEIILSNNQILFDLGYCQVISRLIEGKYPDYQQIIPNSFKTQTVVSREELIKNIKIASLFSGKINDVKITFNPQKSSIEILSKDVDVGENKSKIEAEINGEEEVEVVFDYNYLLGGLNNIFSDKVFFGLNSSTGPSVIRPVGDISYTYVVMPIKA